MYDNVLEELTEELLDHFTKTQNSSVKGTGHPVKLLDGIDLSMPSEERLRVLHAEMNEMIGKSTLRQAEAFLNSMDSVVARIVREMMAGQYHERPTDRYSFWRDQVLLSTSIHTSNQDTR